MNRASPPFVASGGEEPQRFSNRDATCPPDPRINLNAISGLASGRGPPSTGAVRLAAEVPARPLSAARMTPRTPVPGARGKVPIPLEIEGPVPPEPDPFRLEERPLKTRGHVGQSVGGAAAGGVDHPMPGNAPRRSVQRPPHRTRRQPAPQQRRDLPVRHDPPAGNPPDPVENSGPGPNRLPLHVTMHSHLTDLASEVPSHRPSPHLRAGQHSSFSADCAPLAGPVPAPRRDRVS